MGDLRAICKVRKTARVLWELNVSGELWGLPYLSAREVRGRGWGCAGGGAGAGGGARARVGARVRGGGAAGGAAASRGAVAGP